MLQWIIPNAKSRAFTPGVASGDKIACGFFGRVRDKTAITAAALAAVWLVAVFYFLFLLPPAAKAQETFAPANTIQEGVEVIREPLGLPSADIRLIVARIIRVALGLIGIILVVLMIYAGYLWMTAGGNDEQINKAKSILKNAVIGLIIVLSAYSIVLFVLKMLGYGLSEEGGRGIAPNTENFRGSGALGRIIKDHYPMRDQTNVPRNTRIFITFRKPVDVSSFAEDTTGDGIVGNCRPSVINWARDCDQLKRSGDRLSSEQFISIRRTDTGEAIAGGALIAASTTENGIRGVFTIVIRPITDSSDDSTGGGYLGSSTEEVGYTVRLGSGIMLDWRDSAGRLVPAFDTGSIGNNFYDWSFVNSTGLDTDPPFVESVYPGRNQTAVRNSVIQIVFNEAMDPTGIQGDFTATSTDGGYFYVEGENIFLKTAHSALPPGSFSLGSGYRILEFTPSAVCGVNSCGNPIYCLPVCNAEGASCPGSPRLDNYQMLLKAGRPINTSTFEALPFSGVQDASGNALDGNRNNIVNIAPTGTPIFNNWKFPDNDYWQFNVSEEIDSVPPYIVRVSPGLEEAYVPAAKELSLVFSKRMRVEPMYEILIDEKPAHAVPLWRVPRVFFASSTAENTTTTVQILHGPFLDGLRQYYYPVVTSTVQDVHFNCFYPGKGPGVTGVNFPPPRQNSQDNYICEGDSGQCCPVNTSTPGQAVCCGGIVKSDVASTTESCRTYIQGISSL